MVDIALVTRVCKLFIEGPEHTAHLVHVWLGIHPRLPPGPVFFTGRTINEVLLICTYPEGTVLQKESRLVPFEGRTKPKDKPRTFGLKNLAVGADNRYEGSPPSHTKGGFRYISHPLLPRRSLRHGTGA